MKTASELREISDRKGKEKIQEILDGVKKHIEERCEIEALNGNYSYTIYLKQIGYELKNELLEKCIKIAKRFEKNDYDIVIRSDDFNDENKYRYRVNIQIGIYWDKKILNYNVNRHRKNILYLTNNEVNKKCPKCNEEKGIIPRCIHLNKDHTCDNVNGCCFN